MVSDGALLQSDPDWRLSVPRPKIRDDGTRPVHTVLSNASSGEQGGAFPAPMSDDYIMQIMFGAADVNSMPKRVTSHLHHWDEDVGNVEGFGMMAGAEADVAANPSNMRGALDTLVNYGADQVGRFPRVGVFPSFVCR